MNEGHCKGFHFVIHKGISVGECWHTVYDEKADDAPTDDIVPDCYVKQSTFYVTPLTARGLLFRHCDGSQDFSKGVHFDLYNFNNQRMITDAPHNGFIKDKTDPNCEVLNVRGVKYITFHMDDIKFKGEVNLQIELDNWSSSSTGFLFGIVLLAVLPILAIIIGYCNGFCKRKT